MIVVRHLEFKVGTGERIVSLVAIEPKDLDYHVTEDKC